MAIKWHIFKRDKVSLLGETPRDEAILHSRVLLDLNQSFLLVRVAIDREVSGSNPGWFKLFCTHKEKLIYATAPELNWLACRSRAILPTFVNLCLFVPFQTTASVRKRVKTFDLETWRQWHRRNAKWFLVGACAKAIESWMMIELNAFPEKNVPARSPTVDWSKLEEWNQIRKFFSNCLTVPWILAQWNISRKGDINQSDLRTRKCYCEHNKFGCDILFGCDRFISSHIGRWGMAVAREAWPNALISCVSELDNYASHLCLLTAIISCN